MSRMIRGRRIWLGLMALLCAAAVAAPAAGAHTRSFGATSLSLDPNAAAALTSLGVTPGVIAPATANADGSLSFPITDPLPVALATGQINHAGGISLTAGSAQVHLTDFNINLRSRTLSALVGGSRVRILSLDFSGAKIRFRDGQLKVGPVTAALTQAAADALNSAFGVTAFTKGLVLGSATVGYRLWPLSYATYRASARHLH